MSIHDFLNKYPKIVPYESPQVILDSKYDVCMANNGKDNNNNRHIARRVHSVSDSEK